MRTAEVRGRYALNRCGAAVRYAIVDGSIVWYGSVDFLAFGRKDTDVLRFENPDIAGELLAISEEANGEQLMIEDIPT